MSSSRYRRHGLLFGFDGVQEAELQACNSQSHAWFVHLVRELIQLLHDGGALTDDLCITTIQVVHNPTVRPHMDKVNFGLSMTLAVGDVGETP